MSERGSEDAQLVALLGALGDEATYHLLRALLAEDLAAGGLEDEAIQGLDQSGVSRRLKTLRLLGLVEGSGREAVHSIPVRDQVFAVLAAALDLAEAINRHRSEQTQAVRRTLDAHQDRPPSES